MKQFGIKISIVQLGAIQTESVSVMNEPMLVLSKDGPYECIANAIVRGNEKFHDGSPGTQPNAIAKTISKAIRSRNPKTRYAAGKLAGQTFFMRRWLSDKMFDRTTLECSGQPIPSIRRSTNFPSHCCRQICIW